MKEYIKKNKFNILIMLIYSITTLTFVFFHEQWRDEAQNWLIAKDLKFIDIFKQMKYEGHPCLWYFLIAPFAKLGFPYITGNILSWIIMNISAWIIIKKAPFNIWIKCLILLTPPFIYLYSVISRSYCLIALAIVLIAITYENRKINPIKYTLSILLLANTHVIMLGLAMMLYAIFFIEELLINFNKKTKKEKRNIIISLLIAIIGLLFLVIQLAGCLQTNANVNSEFKISTNIFNKIWQTILLITTGLFGKTGNYLIYLIIVFLMAFLAYEFIIHTKNAIIMFISIIFQLLIYTLIYSVSEQRGATIFLIIMLFWWIQNEKNKYKKDINTNNIKKIIVEILLLILLFFYIMNSVIIVVKDIKYIYSGAKETAEFINKNIQRDDVVFVSSHIPIGSSIIPYTNVEKFWNPQLDRYFSFTIWDEKNEKQNEVPIERTIKNTNNRFEDNDNTYFIYCFNWDTNYLEEFIEKTRAIEIFRSESNPIIKDEKYIIYKLYNK